MPFTAEEFKERRIKEEERIKIKAQKNERKANFFYTLLIVGVLLAFWLFFDMSVATFVILLAVLTLSKII